MNNLSTRVPTLIGRWIAPISSVRMPNIGMTLGAGIVIAWLLVALLTPWIAPYSPLAPSSALYQAPTHAHLFGTDDLGRDVFSRVVWGARVTIPSAVLLVIIACFIGGVLGALAGYLGGWVDEVVMRGADLFFSVPSILLAMTVVAALGPGIRNAVIALVVVTWPQYTRVVRGLVLTVMQSDYVAIVRLLGASNMRALSRDVVPNVVGPVVVLAALQTGAAILLLSGLSFLGLGATPPAAEWGEMIGEGADHFAAWWIALFPGLAIVSIVLAFNLIGDGLRDSLDSKSHV